MPYKDPIFGITIISSEELGVELAKSAFRLGIHFFEGELLVDLSEATENEAQEKFIADYEELDSEVKRYLAINLGKIWNSNARRPRENDDDYILGWTPNTVDQYVKFRRMGLDEDRSLENDPHNYLNKIETVANQLQRYGIDRNLVLKALDLDPTESWQTQEMDSACDSLAVTLLEKIVDRKKAESGGETHLVGRGEAIPDSLINEVALLMMASCAWEEMPTPYSLVVLFRAQLDRLGISSQVDFDLDDKTLAAVLLKSAPKTSIRKIALAIDVAPSSVSRWQREQSFQELKNQVAKIRNAEKLIERLAKQRR
jgi:hypothetical protein